ncbi:hypothetical protein FB45DRAFT_900777 [Roridomyces roridus]|uniref:F-box domain-containing protein n=1 Tax=Roridomyces roridus TaxID=1738132 RepID=A0AAD7FTB1_9AGAR|nr:hypothetical protein FB45DRAFT_900777 [Roridomyces roridus]
MLISISPSPFQSVMALLYNPPKLVDVVLLTSLYCSPNDLLQLRETCRRLCQLLSDSLAWSAARRNTHGVPSPPEGFSEVAWASLLFRSKACSECGSAYVGIPECFPLGIQCCSDLCRERITSGQTRQHRARWVFLYAIREKFCYDALQLHRWIPRPKEVLAGKFIPAEAALAADREYKERPSDEAFFQEHWRRQAVIGAWTKTHVELLRWKARFDSIDLDRVNRTVLFQYASSKGLRGADVVRSPTVKDVFALFERDKALIWNPHVLDLRTLKMDLDLLNYHTRLFQDTRTRMDKIKCSVCERMVPTDDFEYHCYDRHPDFRVECLRSCKFDSLVTPEELVDHTLDCHSLYRLQEGDFHSRYYLS